MNNVAFGPQLVSHWYTPMFQAEAVTVIHGHDGSIPTRHHRLGKMVSMLEPVNPGNVHRVPLRTYLQQPAEYFGPNNVLAVAGGDGILGSVIERALAHTKSAKTPVSDLPKFLLMPMGKTNEVARMLGDFDSETAEHTKNRRLPGSITFHNVYPIQLTFHPGDNPDEGRTAYAVYCALVGNPARASRVYDNNVYRKLTKHPAVGRSFEIAVAGLCAAFPASYRLQKAERQSAIIALGGHSAARYMSSPADLRRRMVAIGEQGAFPHDILGHSLKMMVGNRAALEILEGNSSKTYAFDRRYLPTHYSLDGQPHRWQAKETGLSITSCPDPVRIGLLPSHK